MSTHDEIYRRAAQQRLGFMENTIYLDQRQLLNQLQTLGECNAEDESLEGQVVTKRCMDFVEAVGRFKFPATFDEAVREHFQGETT